MIDGPDTLVKAQQALQLAMALHELATNAVKYGALSNGSGHVRITWERRQDKRLNLLWREHGGPPVRPRERKGFGSRLIEQTLDGTRFEFAAEGVMCTLEIGL